MKKFLFQKNFFIRQFQKTQIKRDKISLLETVGVNFAFLAPISTMILRVYFKERRSKRKKEEQRLKEEKDILMKTSNMYNDALKEINHGQLKKAELLLQDILQKRLTTSISPNELVIIENKEKIANVSFSRGNFETALKYFEESSNSRIAILDSFGDIQSGRIEIAKDFLGAAHSSLQLEDFPNSKKFFDLAFEYLNENETETVKANIIYSEYLMKTKNFQKSKELLKQSIEYLIKQDDKEGIAKSYYYLGNLFKYQADLNQDKQFYYQSIEYYKKSKEYVKDKKNIINLGLETNIYCLNCVAFGNASIKLYDLLLQINDKDKEEKLIQAEVVLKEAEQLMRSYYIISNPWILGDCLFAIAELYKRQMNYREAAIYYEDSALMKERNFDTDQNKQVADTLRLAGVMSMYCGNMKQAEKHLNKAREIFKNIGDHLNLSKCLYNISYAYNRQGEYREGLAILELAERYCTLDNNEMLSLIYSNQVLLLTKLAKYQDAIDIFQNRMKDLKGNPTQYELHLLFNIAFTYYKLSQYTKTKEILEQSRIIMENGIPQKNLWHSYYLLKGKLNNKLSFYNQAINDLKKCVEIYQKNHSKYAFFRESATEALITLAKVHFNLSSISQLTTQEKSIEDFHLKEASKYVHQVIQIRQSLYSKSSNEIAEINDLIGFLYFKLDKRIDDALERVQFGLQIRKERSLSEGYDHPDYAKSLSHEAIILESISNDNEKIKEKYELSIFISESSLGGHHSKTANLMIDYVKYLIRKEEYENALIYNMKSLNLLQSYFVEDHPYIIQTHQSFVKIYQSLENEELKRKHQLIYNSLTNSLIKREFIVLK